MKTTLLSIIAVFSLGLIGCSNVGTEPTESAPLYAVQNPYDGETQSEEVGDKKPEKRDTVRKQPQETIFSDLLQRLNLTPEQKPIVERFVSEYRSCVESCVQGLKVAERQILMNSRIQQDAIIAKVKSGELTKEQGRLQLRQLREETQTKLKALPKDKVRECVKSCEEQFIAKLKEILTPEQKITLERWVVIRTQRGTGPTKDTTNTKGRG